jgi:hypothetical protein
LLLVPNQAIGPYVRYRDLQFAFSGLDGVGEINAPGRGPEHSKPLALAGYFGQVMGYAEVEEHLCAFDNRAEVECLGVFSSAGVIVDARQFMVRQSISAGNVMEGTTPGRVEGNFPTPF